MADDEARKQEDLALFNEVNVTLKGLREDALSVASLVSRTLDLTEPTKDALVTVPATYFTGPYWELQRQSLKGVLDAANALRATKSLTQDFEVASTYASTMANTTITLVASYSDTLPVASAARDDLERVVKRYQEALASAPIALSVYASIRRLGLDAQHLREAEEALRVSAFGGAGAASTLLPLRSCIDDSLAALLRRTPGQQKTGNTKAKVQWIGQQCGRRGVVSSMHFATIGDDLHDRRDELSDAKQGTMRRDAIIFTFNRALVTFDAFLVTIDEARLRPPTV